MAEKTKRIREPPSIVFYFKSNKQKNPKPPSKWKTCGFEGQTLNVCLVLWSFKVTVRVTFVILFTKWRCFFFIADKLLAKSLFKRKYVESFGNIGHFIKQRAANSLWTDAFFSRFNSWSDSAGSKAEGLEADSKSAKISSCCGVKC